MDTQTQIDRLIELAIVQRSELKQLVSELPQLREYLSAEIERTFEETEPQIRTELEEFCKARASDEHAKTGAALAAKVEQLSKQLEVTTAAKYSVLMAERAENANLLAKAEARIEDAASMLTHAVKEIVTDELSRFPRAGEIDQLRKEFAEPRGLNPRGRWMPDETYQRLDLVTINGDSFVSNIDGNRERPSRTAGDWTLSAARGNGGGGGGVTSMTDLVPVPSNGQLLIGNGSAFVNSTLTAGTGISISNGAGSITINATDGNITLDDGTAAAPSLNFTNEPTTGLFRASANVMGFAVNGVSRATMTTTGVTVTGTITPSGSVHAAAGSLGNPSIAFNADQNTGLYNIGPDNIGVVANGSKVLDIATTGLGVTGTLSVSGVATLGAGAILNTPASATLTNATGLPISTGVSGLGANVAAFLATPSSANLAAALTDETGTGANVFATSPTLVTPVLGAATGTSLSLSASTAGSAGAGALVVTGGLSAGNNGNASYFGGAVTAAGAISSTQDSYNTFGSAAGQGVIKIGSVGVPSGDSVGWLLFNTSNTQYNWRIASNTIVSGTLEVTPSTAVGGSTFTTPVAKYSITGLAVTGALSTTGAATFAGAVTLQIGSLLNFVGGGSTAYSIQGATSASPYDFRFIGAADAVTQRSFSFGYYTGDNAANAWNQKAAINSYTGAATFAGAVTVPSLFMSTDAQGSVLSSSGNTLFIDAAAGGVTVRPKAGSVFHVSNSAPVRFSAYGAGTATFDSSGNITSVSDARLKNITGTFTKGLAEIVKLTPKLYTWKPETGLVTDDINATLIAQDLIAAGLSEAVTTYRTVPVMEDDAQSAEDIAAGKPVTQHAKLDAAGKAVTQRVDANYSVSDRTVIAALVNAVKELKAEIDALKASK